MRNNLAAVLLIILVTFCVTIKFIAKWLFCVPAFLVLGFFINILDKDMIKEFKEHLKNN